MSNAEIIEAYPELTEERIQAVLGYATYCFDSQSERDLLRRDVSREINSLYE